MAFMRQLFVLHVGILFTIQVGLAQQSVPTNPSDAAPDVLAVVNGHEITRTDFEERLQQYRPEVRGWAEQNKGRVMQELVTLFLLAQEAQKQHLDQEPTTQAQIRLRTNDLLARMVVRKSVDEKVTLTEDAIRQQYEASKGEYGVEEQITASHILVKTAEEATSVLDEIKQGKDFSEVAKARSVGPSGPQGGSLGTFGRGRMVPEFEAAAFALQKDEISAPVQTQFGYHIIKVTDRIEAHTKPLDEVREEVRNALVSKHIETLVAELRGKATIKIVNPDYASE